MPVQFHLASRSPRRAAYLAGLGYAFDVIDGEVPEVPRHGQSPADYAVETAIAKARAGAATIPDTRPVLAADTDVALDGRILGKPRDTDDAVAMLLALAGRRHQVVSAVAVLHGTRLETVIATTDVEFGTVDPDDARAYAASGEPLDKAGAYGIQGYAARWVRAVHGSYTNVVGLPLYETAELLGGFGIHAAPARSDP